MKLTINIPDDLYNGIIKNEYELYNGKFFNIIRNGTPVPELEQVIKELECSKYEDINDGSVDNRQRRDWNEFNKGLELAIKILKRKQGVNYADSN